MTQSITSTSATRDDVHQEVTEYDAIVIGSGIGGLVTATQLAQKGARVVVLERYLIPGGSAGYFRRNNYVFDVGASMIFGLGERPGSTNLLTRALAAVGEHLDTIPDPVQIHYHLPDRALEHLRVYREEKLWLEELTKRFPAEREGIQRFYGECWQVFNALNALELRSLEEPRYLLRVFRQNPMACLTLLRYLGTNVGSIARRHIRDETLLRFIDMDCYVWSVMPADRTPMINGGMVFCDRHYGGVNYPVGGVGQIAQRLARALEQRFPGCSVLYAARVAQIDVEEDSAEPRQQRAVGVRLADGRRLRGRAIISNATRWDTFGLADASLPMPSTSSARLQETARDKVAAEGHSGRCALVDAAAVPATERLWSQLYVKAPSFLSVHLGVRKESLQDVAMNLTDCHHIILERWEDMETAHGARGTLFVSIPTVLDPSVAPPGRHIFHVFTPSWMEEWQGLSPTAYRAQKQRYAAHLLKRLEPHFPGLEASIEEIHIGTPRTHRRFLGRQDGTYGPMTNRYLQGLLTMPFNRTAVRGLYCVGDSSFPGQGLNAVAFSGFAAAHRVAVDLGFERRLPKLIDDWITDWIAVKRVEWLCKRLLRPVSVAETTPS
jgi:prolycopene isomerase